MAGAAEGTAAQVRARLCQTPFSYRPGCKSQYPLLGTHNLVKISMINLTGSHFPWQGMGRGEGGREREREKRAQKRAKESDSKEQQSPERKTGFVSKVRCLAAGGRGAVLDPQDKWGSGPTFSPARAPAPAPGTAGFQVLASLPNFTRWKLGGQSQLSGHSVLTNSELATPRSPRRPSRAACKRPPTAASLIIKSHSR